MNIDFYVIVDYYYLSKEDSIGFKDNWIYT